MTKVLFIDDDEAVRSVASRTLRELGFAVEEADNARQALDAYAADPPDLVITDLIMPDTDGLELMTELKRRHPAVRILAISGGGRCLHMDLLPIAKALGAQGVLPKPFGAAELLAAIENALRAA